MTDELFALRADAAADIEFVGFDSTAATALVPAKAEVEEAEAPAPAKPPRRRRAKRRPRPHAVRVCFDEREILKLTGSAAAEGIPLPDYVRVRALRDNRARGRQMGQDHADLFVPAAFAPPDAKRETPPLSREFEERIAAYYAADGGIPLPYSRNGRDVTGRPKRLARLGHLLIELVGARMPARSALTREGT